MLEQFFRFLAVMNFVFIFASFGGFEAGMFGIVRCLLQMLFFLGIAIIFTVLSENEYYRQLAKKRGRKNEKQH